MTKEKEAAGNLGRTPTSGKKFEALPPEPEGYEFVLRFNDKAELFDVAMPEKRKVVGFF